MAKRLVLFVHGLGGSGKGTWEKFPDLVRDDPDLADYDCKLYEYPTTTNPLRTLKFWKKYPKIQMLSEGLRTVINARYHEYEEIVLVAHSLGGLICRAYLADVVMREEPLRVNRLLLYAVPNTGSGLANIGQYLAWHQPHLKQLCKDSDLISTLNKEWHALRVADSMKVRCVVASGDNVVDKESASLIPGNPDVDVLIGRNHRDCVKPESRDDLSYQVFSRFVLSNPQVTDINPKSATNGSGYRVICFDLDGTLIRGLKFSWTLVWEYLGFPEDVYRAGMRRYLHDKHTYAEWCSWAVKMFRGRKLNRTQFQDIAKDLTITKKLEPALKILRDDGFTIALVSGGIDTLMYEMIPNADELFDEIFINRLNFDAKGVVESVDATEYDFEGKAKALKKVCADRGCSTDQAVFVGEGFNDKHAIAIAGLSIAYPPNSDDVAGAAHVRIEEDNLMRVVESVMRR